MNHREDIKNELNELAPRLSGMEKQNPFRTPDYYFQALPDVILEKAKAAHSPSWTERIDNLVTRLFQPRFAAGFSIAILLLSLCIVYLKKPLDTESQIRFGAIPTETINEFLISDFDEYELRAMVAGSGMNGNGGALQFSTDFTGEDFSDYLDKQFDNQISEEEFL